tara:strand:- start:882 stop:1283 length:402 start_codon:yes stop_codon:yes gene_type:complete
MSKITYTVKGSATSRPIALAPLSIQKIWNRGTELGVNILRVRAVQNRNEISTGATFDGYHKNKVSIYSQKSNPAKELWFRRFVKLNEANKSMQVLEVATNIDVQDTLNIMDSYNTFANGNVFTRFFRKVFSLV